MFLVMQMLNVKEKEIAKLEEFTKLRAEGLRYSEQLLNEDIKAFINFFKQNRETSSAAIKEAD